ncbi:MAG: metallophosphoesterase [Planctomycetes bacterium]|nr:metallophosphoesterase [Planctomycetota bacterium]
MGTARIIVRRLVIPLPRLPRRLAGLRIAHISDLHFRKRNGTTTAAQKQLIALDYDLLVVTGDFADYPRKWPEAIEMMRAFFEPLADRSPIYAVLGNHDDPRIADAADGPLTFLRNAFTVVDFKGETVVLAGVEQSHSGGEDLATALAAIPTAGAVILLAHFPSTVFRVPSDRVDLVLAGHTHGGQIRLPVVGCLWTNDRLPLRMARGLTRVGGTLLHASPGIGVSGPIKVRINCPPEISLLTLQPARFAESPEVSQLAAPCGVQVGFVKV